LTELFEKGGLFWGHSSYSGELCNKNCFVKASDRTYRTIQWCARRQYAAFVLLQC